jgi:PAS domain S-box-containing protein
MGVLNPQDGLQRWISVSAYPHFPSGAEKPEGVFTTIEDITQRRQAYAALDAEKNRARTYLDIAAVMLVALDCDGRITLMNNKGSQILGYGEDDLLGKDWFETCLPERERQEVRASFAQIMQGQTSDLEYYENSVLTKTGEERLIGWFNRVIHDGNGSITGTLSSGEDITERRQAESRINQQIEELRRWQQAMLGREERVLELKREVNALLAASGKKPRYTSVAEEKDG